MARTNAREEIIRRGAELIHAQGFHATGLKQILQAVGIPKGSFYFYFKSKDDFGLEIIDYFQAAISGIFRRYLNDKKIPPLRRLDNLFEYYETAFQKNGSARGCPIGNLSLELADSNERLRFHLGIVIDALVAQIELCLQDARRDKSLPADLNTAEAARFVFHGFEGAVLHMKVVKSIEPFRSFRNYYSGYLKTVISAEKK